MKETQPSLSGLLIVNKPLTWSSMDVIRQIRKLTKIKKVGHAGTLDPLANGVLLVCISREATRHIDKLMTQSKTYEAVIDLSAFSTTDDAEGEKTAITPTHKPSLQAILQVLQNLHGTIMQVPPAYSAIKINGKRAYKLARADKHVHLKPRPVTIDKITVQEYSWPKLAITIQCGKGTYIRSLARDIGKALDTGGYITHLTRTTSGPYTLEKAFDIRTIKAVTADMLTPCDKLVSDVLI